MGVLAGALVGGAFGMLHAFLTVRLALSQHVTGLGITLLATSLSYYAYRLRFPRVSTPPTTIPSPGSAGSTCRCSTCRPPLTFLALLAVPAVAYFLFRTPAGLAVRTAGENPFLVEAQGLSVTAIRTSAVVAGSALMGVGGSFLTLSQFNAFYFNMVNGRGWVCIALLSSPPGGSGKALFGALLFAAIDAAQLRLQQSGAFVLPYQAFLLRRPTSFRSWR